MRYSFRYRSAGQARKPRNPKPRRSRAEPLQYLLRLRELLDQPVHVGDRRAAPAGDPLAAAGVQQLDVPPLGARHRVDDRLDALELALGAREVCAAEHLLDARDHAEQLAHRAHLPDGAQLRAEILQVELVPAEFLLQRLGLRVLVGLLGALDEREDVAHAEDARSDALRVEGLERVQLLARACEHDRLAGDGAQRERRTAARIALDLGEHDAGDREPPREALGRRDRVLPGHGVGDEEHLVRRERRHHALELAHELVVDRLPPGGVDQHGVAAARARGRDPLACNRDRVATGRRRMDRQPELARERLELGDRGRPVHVGGDEVRGAPALGREPARELRRGGGLPRAVQTDQHDDHGRRPAEVEPGGPLAEEPRQLAVHEPHEVLLGRETAQHLGAERVALDGLDEVADDVQVDVGLEEGEAHVPQRLLDVPLGDLPVPSELAQQGVELLAEGFEHRRRWPLFPERRGYCSDAKPVKERTHKRIHAPVAAETRVPAARGPRTRGPPPLHTGAHHMRRSGERPRYIMPPMPPGGMDGAAVFSSGFSATIASVVRRSPATDAAFSSAVRTTLVGSMMPALSRSSYSSLAALKPKAPFPFFTLSSTIEPSAPALFAIQRSGSSIAFFTILTPKRSSSETSSLSSTPLARMSATPPPGTMPSSTAARVACSASSTRAFFSFISTSVAAPTRTTPTPPTHYHGRPCGSHRAHPS